MSPLKTHSSRFRFVTRPNSGAKKHQTSSQGEHSMIRKLWIVLILLPTATLAQEKLDITTPQVQMHNRISAMVDQRAQQLGLSQDVVTYCRIELNHKTETFPKNGSIPFGINYNQITDMTELTIVITGREAYEKTFMLLCLSRAKRDLSVAE